MRVKVCGLREPDNIRAVDALGPDYIGFIFFPKSPRYVGESFEMPSGLKARKVGVFVNERNTVIAEKAGKYGLDYIQLHGNEAPSQAEELKALGLRVIKAMSIASEADLSGSAAYEGIVDYFLFDTKCPGFGGSGSKFDWNVLRAYRGSTPFLLSGGIGPEDSQCILGFDAQGFIGIDLNSRFEFSPGLKNIDALKDFMCKMGACPAHGKS